MAGKRILVSVKFALVLRGQTAQLIGPVYCLYAGITDMLRAGIVGLPNVGKSTLFNAVTRTRKAEAANYPFCTIDPNIGIVTVPDARLEPLSKVAKTAVIIPAAVEFVDIAGLVKGASQGEGLGNKFLSHIREVDAIVQVVRCFEDPDIHHVAGAIDPIRDIETIITELVLSDLDAVKKRLEKVAKDAKRVFGGHPSAIWPIRRQRVEAIDHRQDSGAHRDSPRRRCLEGSRCRPSSRDGTGRSERQGTETRRARGYRR